MAPTAALALRGIESDRLASARLAYIVFQRYRLPTMQPGLSAIP
jgi:hypothetical protein